MKKIISVILLLVYFLVAFPQTVTLTFTGRDAVNNYVQLDSVSVVNMTRGWQEILYWPDTVLKMQAGVGIDDNIVGTHVRASAYHCNGANRRGARPCASTVPQHA